MAKKKLTPKQRVRAVYPRALSEQLDDSFGGVKWRIWPGTDINNIPMAAGYTAAAAWADAARTL